MKKNEKGFALVLSLVLLLVMSLMGGALIVISSVDHRNNNSSDDYQQTFYVAETALLEGEKYVVNQFLGPWTGNPATRDTSNRKLAPNDGAKFVGIMNLGNMPNKQDPVYQDTGTLCYNSFKDLDRNKLENSGVVRAESSNFGKLLSEAFKKDGSIDEIDEADKLKNYFYEFFIYQVGAAPFRGYGSSVKKGQNNTGQDGMAYRIYGCGVNMSSDKMVVALESMIVLPTR
tara:strand:+ start:1984 stop:2673 length:690 start_codon:yes stop_codon:yes gene_type:complete